MKLTVGATVEDILCQCSICGETKKAVFRKEVAWNSYDGERFGDQTHEYIFCEDCIHDMIEGKPLKGRLKHFITGDPALAWSGLDTNTLEEKEREMYSRRFFKQLEELNKNAE